MEEQIAKAIIAAGFVVGLLVWLAALRLYRRMADHPRVERVEMTFAGKSPAEAIRAILAAAMPMLGMARLSRPTEHALVVSNAGVEARINAERTGGRTLVTAEIDDTALTRRVQTIMAILVVLVMPVVVAGVPALLWYFAAPNDSPNIRWQCVQVVQIVHVLWPPFLVYFLWKKPRDMIAAAISNLLVRADASAPSAEAPQTE